MSPLDGSRKETAVVNEINSFSLQDVGEFGVAVSGKEVAKVPATATQYEAPANLKERIKALLIAGATSAQAAGALGIEESYVAQLRQNEQFSQEVIEQRAIARGKINDQYDSYELKLLEKLGEMIDMPMKPFEIFKALQIVGSRKREAVLPQQEAAARNGSAAVVVNLQLNPQVAQRFILDASRKDIIGIAIAGAGRQEESVTFVPMPSSALIAEAKEVEKSKLSKLQDSKSPPESDSHEESLQNKDSG